MPDTKIYLSLARLDNWPKNLFMFSGVVAAWFLYGAGHAPSYLPVMLGLISLCFASSANYILNDWLDAAFDLHHPVKSARRLASGNTTGKKHLVALEYCTCVLVALFVSSLVSHPVMLLIVAFLASGMLYNVPPMRFKEIAYADVLLESLNYPIRLLLGWYSVTAHALPPSSLVLLAWSIGAFMMTVKRLAEYQLFSDSTAAALYRRSYAVYTVHKLLILAMLYATFTSFTIAVFLIKYRIELMLLYPFICIWLAWYLALGLRRDETVIYPERLAKQSLLMLFSMAIGLMGIVLVKVNIPVLAIYSQPLHYATHTPD